MAMYSIRTKFYLFRQIWSDGESIEYSEMAFAPALRNLVFDFPANTQ